MKNLRHILTISTLLIITACKSPAIVIVSDGEAMSSVRAKINACITNANIVAADYANWNTAYTNSTGKVGTNHTGNVEITGDLDVTGDVDISGNLTLGTGDDILGEGLLTIDATGNLYLKGFGGTDENKTQINLTSNMVQLVVGPDGGITVENTSITMYDATFFDEGLTTDYEPGTGAGIGSRDYNDARYWRWVTAPASNSASGLPGQIAEDDDYVYVAIGTNSWKRAAISTW